MLKERLYAYRKQRNNIIEGKLNCIPFDLDRLSKYVPGIMQGIYYCITSFSNVGKTPLVKFMFVHSAIKAYKELLGTKNEFNLKIFYFCLEETREQFIDSLISSFLYTKYNIEIDYATLNSFNNPMDSDILHKISTLADDFLIIEKVLNVVTNVTSPHGIISIIRKYAHENGLFFNGEDVVAPGEEFTHYLPNDPDERVIIITDHINLLSADGKKVHELMEQHCTQHMLHECVNTYKYSVCDVHQQAAEGENAEYNKFMKNAASLAGLGDNKKVQRNYQVVFGLDMPQRYDIMKHAGYDLTRFKDSSGYRGLTLLKNRFGRPRVRFGLWFKPQAIMFETLEEQSKINYDHYV